MTDQEVQDQENCQEPKEDYSLLRQPIDIGVTGAVQVAKCLQEGTEELRDLLLYECDLIYECKICRSLFRGLANFISHKRVYCTKYYQDHLLQFVDPQEEDGTIVIQPESPEETAANSKKDSQSKSVLSQMLDGSFKGKSPAYNFYTKATEEQTRKADDQITTVVQLKPIEGNANAMHQTVREVSGNGSVVIEMIQNPWK